MGANQSALPPDHNTTESHLQENVDEDYGKLKMEIFKQQCRNILMDESEKPKTAQSTRHRTENQLYGEPSLYDDRVSYPNTDDNAIDIISAYKSLKLAMTKNTKGLNIGREVCSGKNYLKPTVASRQGKRVKPMLGSSGLPPLSADGLNNNNRRVKTAPTNAMLQTTNIRANRGAKAMYSLFS